jgi:hypothetical protein
MAEALAQVERFEIRGLCSFFVKKYRSYTGRNPRSSGLPDFLLNKILTLLETERCRKNFMVIVVHIFSIDWLLLNITGNRRALFEWDNCKLRYTLLVP